MKTIPLSDFNSQLHGDTPLRIDCRATFPAKDLKRIQKDWYGPLSFLYAIMKQTAQGSTFIMPPRLQTRPSLRRLRDLIVQVGLEVQYQ